MTALLVDEPLAESAPLALRLGPTLCRRDPATGENCSWNHAPWQFLRLMGLALTPASHACFYRSAIDAVTRPGTAPRVLISGAADYSMLAHVLAAMRLLQCRPEVTVLDLCETPLMLNRWYAERAGERILASAIDILQYQDENPFDLICTDSFLGRFSSETRPVLLEKWRSLLRPGGAVVTVNGVRKPGEGRRAFAPEQAHIFHEIVRSGAASLRATMDFDVAELDRLVRAYTARPGAIPVQGRQEFLDPFQRTGFVIERVLWGTAERGIRTDVRGPRVPGDGEYGHIIARRR